MMMSLRHFPVFLVLISASAFGQSNISAEDLAKDSYQIVILSEVAKYANMQRACSSIGRISEINPKEILELDVKPVLIHYATREGKPIKSVDSIIDKLLQASTTRIENTPIAIHVYNNLRNRVSESGVDYCATLHQLISHLIDKNINSIMKIKKSIESK